MKKIYRVTSNEDFGGAVHKGIAKRNSCYVIHARENELNHARVGISVSKKLGVAVVRNKIKRQVRAIVGELIDFENSKPIDIVIVVKDGFLKNSFEYNKNSLNSLITNLMERINEK